MPPDKTPRILQQQPSPDEELQQEQQSPEAKQQMGEGSYEGTRDYNRRQAEYMKTHDVKKDAEAAKPKSEEEARELKQAEEEGKSHSKGEH
ncbi:MAG TPA: hypothetical protein VL593_17890 [Ramlibacter sp.]|jgi:hypothetical protein|nr:hypothetical protein [Ramlibacter sp.]